MGNRFKRTIRHLRSTLGPAEESDSVLLARFSHSRDSAAFAALVQRHGRMVFGTCRRVLGHQQDAEDAFQATFLVLARRAASVRSGKMLPAWLHAVARRTALALRRSTTVRSRRERSIAVQGESAFAPSHEPDLSALLDRELSLLPERYRSAVVVCDLEGLSRRDAARRLGWSEGTLSGRLFRARAILAKRLSRYGLASAATALAGMFSDATACPSPCLVTSTAEAAAGWVTGQAIPTMATFLAEGMMKAMFITKLKGIAVAILMTCLVAGGAVGYRALATESPAGVGRTTRTAQANDEPRVPRRFEEPKARDPESLLKQIEVLSKEIAELRRKTEQDQAAAVAARELYARQVREAQVLIDHERAQKLKATRAAEEARAVAEKHAAQVEETRALRDANKRLMEQLEQMRAQLQSDRAARDGGSRSAVSPLDTKLQEDINALTRERNQLTTESHAISNRLQQLDANIASLKQAAQAKANAQAASGGNIVPSKAVPTAGPPKLSLQTYQVDQLVDDHANRQVVDVSADLIRVITQMVAPQSWSTQGGPGTIAYFPKTKTLFVNQTSEIQDQVQALLKNLKVFQEQRAEQIRADVEQRLRKQ